jgi:hypothetical protein
MIAWLARGSLLARYIFVWRPKALTIARAVVASRRGPIFPNKIRARRALKRRPSPEYQAVSLAIL